MRKTLTRAELEHEFCRRLSDDSLRLAYDAGFDAAHALIQRKMLAHQLKEGMTFEGYPILPQDKINEMSKGDFQLFMEPAFRPGNTALA